MDFLIFSIISAVIGFPLVLAGLGGSSIGRRIMTLAGVVFVSAAASFGVAYYVINAFTSALESAW